METKKEDQIKLKISWGKEIFKVTNEINKIENKQKKEWKSKDMSLGSIKLKTSNYNDVKKKRGHKLFILETREMTFLQIIYYQKDKRLPGGTGAKTLPANARDAGSIPSLGRFHISWCNEVHVASTEPVPTTIETCTL